MFPRVRASLDAAKTRVLAVQVTRTDFMQLGTMYSTDGMASYGGSLMRVVLQSPLFYVLKMLLDDPGFRVGVAVHEHFDLLALPTMADKHLGVTYVVNVPADMVWAALAFIVCHWGKEYGVGLLRYTSEMNAAEFAQFLGRFQYTPDDVQAITEARCRDPAAVNAVYDAILRSSALLAVVVKKQSAPPINVGDRDPAMPGDLPDAPSGPVADASEAESEPAKEETPHVPRRITNEEAAEELCAFIVRRSESAPEAMRKNAPFFCETVRATLAEFTQKGVNLAEMDAFTQGKHLEAGAALAVSMAYTLCSLNRNPYLVQLIDLLLMARTPAPGEPDPDWDAAPAQTDENATSEI